MKPTFPFGFIEEEWSTSSIVKLSDNIYFSCVKDFYLFYHQLLTPGYLAIFVTENAEDQVLEVSESALKKLARVAEDPETAGKGVRIYPAGIG